MWPTACTEQSLTSWTNYTYHIFYKIPELFCHMSKIRRHFNISPKSSKEGVQIPRRPSSCWQNQRFQLKQTAYCAHVIMAVPCLSILFKQYGHTGCQHSEQSFDFEFATLASHNTSEFESFKYKSFKLQCLSFFVQYIDQSFHHKELSILPLYSLRVDSHTLISINKFFLSSTKVCLILQHPTAYDHYFT